MCESLLDDLLEKEVMNIKIIFRRYVFRIYLRFFSSVGILILLRLYCKFESFSDT
jgi:hypothetical protein